MKNSILIVLAFMLCTSAFAQDADRFSIGPRLGINIASVSNVSESEALVGIVGGVTSTYSFSESSGLTIDLLYSGEGFGHEFSDSKVRLGYIVIPIYYNLFFGDLGDALRPKVYAGIAPGIPISAKQDGDDISDVFSGINFALSAGGGVNYRLADRIWLNADLRAFIGLTDLRDKNSQEGDTVAGRNIQISVGVAYGLAKI